MHTINHVLIESVLTDLNCAHSVDAIILDLSTFKCQVQTALKMTSLQDRASLLFQAFKAAGEGSGPYESSPKRHDDQSCSSPCHNHLAYYYTMFVYCRKHCSSNIKTVSKAYLLAHVI